MSIYNKKKTPPNISELTPLSVNLKKKNATKSLLEKPFSIVFCKGMFEKTPPNICEFLTPLKRVDTSWGKTKIPLGVFFPQGNRAPWKRPFFCNIKNILGNNFLYKVMDYHQKEVFFVISKICLRMIFLRAIEASPKWFFCNMYNTNAHFENFNYA